MITKTNCQNHGFIIGHPLYSVYQLSKTLVSIVHIAHAFIDKILKKIVQIFEWLGKFVTKFYTNSLLGLRDMIFKAKRSTKPVQKGLQWLKTVHETTQTEQ